MSIPSMPLFCGDYLKDTTDLTLEEHGAYLMILMITWATGGKPLLDDDARMAKRLSIAKDRWANKLKPVLAQFFDLSGGTWRNQRLEKEWNYVQEKISARREAGMKGGRPRKNGPQNGPDSPAPSREDFSQTHDANALENNETPKPNGSGLHKQTESTQPPYSSAYAEEREVDSCVSLESTPCAPVREAVLTQAPPVSSATKATNIVQFQPGRSSEVLPIPDDWTLPNDWYLLAIKAGWHDPEGAAEKFHTHWLGKRDRGDRDAANSEAVWLKLWQGWINRNLKWERDHGKQRHDHQRQRGHGDFASYVKSHCAGWVADAAGGSNPW
jgi:uncharacterized protein YdaU (DUF1376 family)